MQVVEFAATTRTAADAAAAIGCQVEQIAKSLVFRGRETGQPDPGDRQSAATGSMRRRLRELAGEPIEKPDADYVRERTGFAIGGVPPVGHREPLTVFIDEDLLHFAKSGPPPAHPTPSSASTPPDSRR